MYFVPLSQLESVELLVHSLKAAAGEADCTMCPAYRVCMKQCLTIAGSIEQLLERGALPQFSENQEDVSPPQSDNDPEPPAGGSSGKSGLWVVK
ncbi:MAG: hypothetical protein DRH06_09570 [Deltaproteobacteria bacterium]|nr:MAG: hypothetical protein DRH06_09570 [Deltaproteobacteria bacterium]